jgi:hypothetical protein
MKKIVTIIMLLFIGMALFTGCSSNEIEYIEKQQTSSNVGVEAEDNLHSNSEKIEYIDWNSFSNKTHNFEFKFPKEYEIVYESNLGEKQFYFKVNPENTSEKFIEIKLKKLVGRDRGTKLYNYIYLGNEDPTGNGFDSYINFDELVENIKVDETADGIIFEIKNVYKKDLYTFYNRTNIFGVNDLILINCDYRFIALTIINNNQNISKQEELELIARSIIC